VVGVHGYGGVDCLEEAVFVYAGDEEAGFVHGFGAFCAGSDADGWEGVALGGEEAGFFREGAGVGDDGVGVHLETVVVMEAEGLVLDDASVELEAGFLEAVS